jgi:hypothetical protein
MPDAPVIDWRLAISLLALVVSAGALIVPYWRRPRLSLRRDQERTHSRVEGNCVPYLRLLVGNAKRKRSAQHARVLLDGYRAAGAREPLTRLGSPFLGWPSVTGQDSDSYVAVVFSNAERPVGLGQLARVKTNEDDRLVKEVRWTQGLAVPEGPDQVWRYAHDDPEATWYLHLELADGLHIIDERDWLPPGKWTVRLIVGADHGDARAYEVDISWKGDEDDADAVLAGALDSVAVRRVRS